MNKKMFIILSTIGGQIGLNAEQVKSMAASGDLDDRYQLCKGCRMVSCDRCQIAYSQEKNKAPM